MSASPSVTLIVSKENLSLLKQALIEKDLREVEAGINTGAPACRDYGTLMLDLIRQARDQANERTENGKRE